MSNEGQFDKDLPAVGWSCRLMRNTFRGEIVGQLPRSQTIITPNQTNARNDKEWHLLVHDISPILDEHFKAYGIEVGDRVIISGSAVTCFYNEQEFQICPMNSIQCVLKREDGEKFVGSKYRTDAA